MGEILIGMDFLAGTTSKWKTSSKELGFSFIRRHWRRESPNFFKEKDDFLKEVKSSEFFFVKGHASDSKK